MKLNLQIQISNTSQLLVEASSIEELEAVRGYLSAQNIKSGLPEGKAAENKTAADESTAGKTATEPKADKPKAEAAGKGKAGAKAAATAKTDAGPTIEDVTAKLLAVADKFGLPEAHAMNKRFGVKKAGELKPEQYPAYIKFATHCLEDEAEPTGAHPDFDEAGETSEDDISSLV